VVWIAPASVREIVQALLEVLASGQRGALATVVRTSGSTPQQPGARLLLRPDGSCVGTIGGGAIEYVVLDALRNTRESGKSQLLAHDLGYDLGMCCGGRMEVFIEPVEAAPRLFLFGAGHVAKSTAALARSVGFEVTVVDEREELNSGDRFPGCRLELRDPADVIRRENFGERDWLLIATHDHQLDEETLDLALQQRPRYVGLMGSRRKVFRLLQRIAARRGGVPTDRLYGPVGLDIGAVSPEEIAVSIVSELVALRHGKEVAHLRAVDDARLTSILEEQRDDTK
jgi:xanthine dehydrogenase accessory factor